MTCPPPPSTTQGGTEGADDPFEQARRAGRAARSGLRPDDRERASAAAARALCDLEHLSQPSGTGRIGLSRPIRDELDVSTAARRLRSTGWSVWLPVVVQDRTTGSGSMTFREWRADDVLVPGAFGIEEPPDDGRGAVSADALSVVVAPCVAVDRAGTRVGFGAGYYDRALAEPDRRPEVVVAAFDVQVLADELPRRPWDVPADVVVTERRTWRPERS